MLLSPTFPFRVSGISGQFSCVASIAPEQFFVWGVGILSVCQAARSVPLDMSRMNPECHDSDTLDPSVAADVLLRQEPDEEEDEGKDDDGDLENDDGYSE